MNEAVIRHADAVAIRVECDEQGFELHIVSDDATRVFNIQACAVDLLSAVERTIAPWHREGMAVLREMRAAGAFGDDAFAHELHPGYNPSDPKHPDYHSVHADHYDMRERNPDEYEYLRLEAKREKAGEA